MRSSRPIPAVSWVVWLLLGAATMALGDAPEPGVVLKLLDGDSVAGRLLGLDARQVVVQPPGQDQPRTVAMPEVREIRWVHSTGAEPSQVRWRATLLGGERVIGSLGGAGLDGIRLEVAGAAQPISLSFERLLTLERLAPEASLASLAEDLHPRVDASDVVYDLRGDEVRGIVAGGNADGLRIESERGRERIIAWDQLRVVHLENEALAPAEGEQVEVEARDGSRWLASGGVRLDADALVFVSRSLPQLTLRLPLAQASALWRQDGRFAYASQLPFQAAYEHYYDDPPEILRTDALTRWYGARVDRRPQGTPLRMAGATYRRGFGVQSGSRIDVTLEGGFASFDAWFGIDDGVLELSEGEDLLGNVDARVLADGKVIWEAKGVRGGATPQRIGPLDVRGVKVLSLIVDHGAEGWTRDRANWADPVLVRP